MTGTMLFATVIDIAVVILLIIGFINEEKIIEIEDKLIYLAAKSLKKYLRRRSLKKKAAQKIICMLSAHARAMQTKLRSINSVTS